MATRLTSSDRIKGCLARARKWAAGNPIPFVQQLSSVDCGPACLAMVLAYHRRGVEMPALREAVGIGRAGSGAQDLLFAANQFGLRGNAVRVSSLEDLDLLPTGAILHWRFNHFVVFEAATRKGIVVIDPATGRRRVPLAEANGAITGVALVFETGEGFVPSQLGRRAVWGYLRDLVSRAGGLPRILCSTLVLQGITLVPAVLVAVVVDRVIPAGETSWLLALAPALLAVLAFHFLLSLIRSHLLLEFQTKLDSRLSADIFEHLVALPMTFFRERSRGDLLLRLNSASVVRELLTSGVLSTILDAVLSSTYLLLLFATNGLFGCCALVLGVLRIAIYALGRRPYRDVMARCFEQEAQAQSYQVQALSGIESIKVSGSEPEVLDVWMGLFRQYLNSALQRGRLAAWVEASSSTLSLAAPLLLTSLGALLVLDQRLDLGEMLAANVLALGFLNPLATLVATGFRLEALRSLLERLEDILASPREQSPGGRRRVQRLEGRVCFEEVRFRYARAERDVLDAIGFEVEPGSKVVVVGPSGAGKSTLAALLVGLYPPTAGRVLLDGLDLATLDLGSVRRQIGYVPQQPFLFGTTIRRNITLSAPELTVAQVVWAARTACIHEEILALPLGYETLLGDDGSSISGGQRQRIALARAVARRPSLLVLDEATSAVDVLTENRIFRNLARFRATQILVAHRIATARSADWILVLAEGRVAEQGRHEDLVRGRGLYAELYAQSRGTNHDR